MMTRLLLASFFVAAILGAIALSTSGCDDDVQISQDLSVLPDLSKTHD